MPYIKKEQLKSKSTEKFRIDQSGNSTLMGMAFSFLAITLVALYLGQIVLGHYKLKQRTQVYLCFRFQIKLIKNYIPQMANTNRALQISYPLLFTPWTATVAKVVQRSTKVFQNILHAKLITNLLKNKYCTKKQTLALLFNLPYQSRLIILKRQLNGVVKPNPNSKIFTLTKTKFWALKDRFALRAKIKLTNPYQKKVSIKSWETINEGILRRSFSFGFL